MTGASSAKVKVQCSQSVAVRIVNTAPTRHYEIARVLTGQPGVENKSGRVLGRTERNGGARRRVGSGQERGNEAMEMGVGMAQAVGEGARTTGEGPLRVVRGAKLVGNVTLRVSKGDRRNGMMEGWNAGILELKGVQSQLFPAGNRQFLRRIL
jgi:hypothetical protein